MESESAFSVYQKANDRKRKLLNNSSDKAKQLLHTKKSKKHTNHLNALKVVEDKPSFANLNNKSNGIKKLKNKNKKFLPRVKHLNKDHYDAESVTEGESDEIPDLVPIDDVTNEVADGKKKLKSNSKKNGKKNLHKELISLETISLSSDSTIIPTEDISHDVSAFNPVTQGLAIFKWIIDPISPKEFFGKYWEKDVLHIKRANTNYFEDVFSSTQLDNIIREYPLYFTRNIDVVSYENGKKEVHNPEGRAVASQLYDYYLNGCSVRVLNPQTYDPNVHSLISSLQEYFGAMVGTNVYLTPPASQGFAPHFDDIEAFILQLEGSKHWKLYKPKNEDVLARDSSINFKSEDLGKPFMEVTLNAGDVLYFPRGTIHEGCTRDDHSLHITVSVYQHTAYADLLEHILPDALKRAACENVEFRKGLPLNYLKNLGVVNQNSNSVKRQNIINRVKKLMESLIDYIDVDTAADQLGRKFMYDAMPPLLSLQEANYSAKLDGDFMKNGRIYNRIEISSEVRVRLLRYYCLRIVKDNDNTSTIFYCTDNAKSYHGEEEQSLQIDNALIPVIEILQKTYPEFIVIENIAGEDENVKLQLISDLWERGLIVTEEPLPNISSDVEEEEEEDSENEKDDAVNAIDNEEFSEDSDSSEDS